MHIDRSYLYFPENLKKAADTDVIAAICGEDVLSYKDLWKFSNAVASLVCEKKDKSPVVIWGDKENEILPCIYGAIMGGHPYTFIPSHYPAERISTIMNDCGATKVFAPGRGQFPLSGDFEMFDRDNLLDFFNNWNGEEVGKENYLGYDDIWVIFYTSGSTGKPKGVPLNGNNIATKMEMANDYFAKYYSGPGFRLLNLSSYAFSICITNVFSDVPIRSATLISIPTVTLRDYSKLFVILLQTDPDGFCATPSLIELFMKDDRFSREYLPSMKYFCFGGEILNSVTAKKLLLRFPDLNIYNGYGATEMVAAPFVCLLTPELIESADDDSIMPVGLEDGYGSHSIVDSDGNELPDGEVGELVTTGKYVCHGYLNCPEQTAAKFSEEENGLYTYRTGDLMYRKDGKYYFKGRKDNMVKVGGYRVELEDVENNLRKIDIVRNCVAVPVCRDESVIMLAAYIVPKDPGMSKIEAIKKVRTEMSRLVQDYMVPQRIKIVEELPYNNSNKIDRAKLAAENRIN